MSAAACSEPRPAGARLSERLALAAAPTFAAMAALTYAFDDGPSALLCAGGGGFALGGMVPMYLLMSAFHVSPWLRLFARA